MKKFTLFAMLLCSVSLMAEVPAYLSDGALVRLGENFMEENIIHVGDVPELEQGTMVYDPVNHVLTLYGVLIHTSSAADYGLAVSCANMPEGGREMEVRLIGENYIYAEKTGIMGGLIFGEGTFTVTGPAGSLYVTTNNGNGMFLMCNELTVKDGAYIYAGYENGGLKTRIGIGHLKVERATTPSANNVKTGEFLSGSWYYLDGNAVKQLEFDGLTDGEPIDDSSLATLVTGVSGMQDMAFNFRNSVMYATAADKLYAVDIEEEQLAEVGSYEYDGKAVAGITGIAINGAGVIYLLESGNPSGTLYTVGNIDAKEKKVTLELVGETGQLGVEVPAAAQSIAFDHVTGELFWGDSEYLRILSTDDAKAHICGDLGMKGGTQKLLIDGVLYIVRNGRIYTPDGQLVR